MDILFTECNIFFCLIIKLNGQFVFKAFIWFSLSNGCVVHSTLVIMCTMIASIIKKLLMNAFFTDVLGVITRNISLVFISTSSSGLNRIQSLL